MSAIVALDDDTLLVLERTDLLAKVFLVQLGGVTDLLGAWDCVGAPTASPFLGGVQVPECSTTPQNPSHKSVEQMSLAELAANGIVPIASTGAKSLVTVLDSRAGMPEKIEGIAVVNRVQLAIANDNDFNVLAGGNGVAFSTATGDMILRNPTVPSQILRIQLDRCPPAVDRNGVLPMAAISTTRCPWTASSPAQTIRWTGPSPPARRPLWRTRRCAESARSWRAAAGTSSRRSDGTGSAGFTAGPIFGSSLSRQCLEAGLLDELVIHLVPVLLGGGVRLYGGDGDPQIELERISLGEAPRLTDLRFRVVR